MAAKDRCRHRTVVPWSDPLKTGESRQCGECGRIFQSENARAIQQLYTYIEASQKNNICFGCGESVGLFDDYSLYTDGSVRHDDCSVHAETNHTQQTKQ